MGLEQKKDTWQCEQKYVMYSVFCALMSICDTIHQTAASDNSFSENASVKFYNQLFRYTLNQQAVFNHKDLLICPPLHPSLTQPKPTLYLPVTVVIAQAADEKSAGSRDRV